MVSPSKITSSAVDGEIITIRPDTQFLTTQGLPNFHGISAGSAGAKGICMHLVVFPPDAQAHAHFHDGFETAIYIVEGEIETRYGIGLKHAVVNGPGDFIFIPAGVPHRPRNLSSTRAAKAIVSRNDANEQENVVLYPVL